MEKTNTLTITKVAKHIGVSLRTMYNMVSDGRFPVAPISSSDPRRWNIEDVEKWRLHG